MKDNLDLVLFLTGLIIVLLIGFWVEYGPGADTWNDPWHNPQHVDAPGW